MSTRSYIGYLQDNIFTGVYCHYDGFINSVGKTLFVYYDTFEKVKELISFGDISTLCKSIKETDFFDECQEIFKCDENDLSKINSMIQFVYIFDVKKEKWYVIDRSKSLKRRYNLMNALKKLNKGLKWNT